MNRLTIAMLKAIHAMLKGCKPEKVECASEILSQLIEHLEKNPLDLPDGTLADGISRTYIDSELDEEAIQAQKELRGE